MFYYTHTHTPRYTYYNYESKTLDVATCTLPTKNGFHRTPKFGKYGGNISLKGGDVTRCPTSYSPSYPFVCSLFNDSRTLYQHLKVWCLITTAQHSTVNPSHTNLLWSTYMLLILFAFTHLGSLTQFVKHAFQVGCSTTVDTYFIDYTPAKIHGTGLFFTFMNGGTVNFCIGSIIRSKTAHQSHGMLWL